MNAVISMETPMEAARRLAAPAIREGFKLTDLHYYESVGRSEAYYVIRCKRDGEKWIRPMHMKGTHFRLGLPPMPANGRALYRLPHLLVDANPVFIVEGELKADGLAALGITATTSGSATSANGFDWRPLGGGHRVMWQDNDDAGRKYAEEVTSKLHFLGCRVEWIDVAALGLPEGGDVVDWLELHPGATADDVLALPRLPTIVAQRPIPERAKLSDIFGVDDDVSGSVSFGSGPPESSANIARPLPAPLPAVPQFSPTLLPESVRAWCTDAAEGLQVPLDFTAVPAMVALAGVIGRRIGIAMKQHDHWVEVPMLWGCVVGRPSSGKSPALSPARRMLERLERDERDDFDKAMREHEAHALIADANKYNAKKAIQAALKKGDRLAAESAADNALFDGDPPTEPRIVANDATVEKLGELLNANPQGLVQFRDELSGWLASLDREGREGDRSFWLECWNGVGGYVVDRIGRGTIRIEACAMSILGGMHPGKVAEYVRGAVRGGYGDDGLMQRFQLAVYPDLPASWEYIDRPLDPRAEQSAWVAFQRLRNLDPDAVGAERADWCDVPFLRFDHEAQGLLIEWQTTLMHRLRAGDEPPWMESHLSKYRSLAGRLALVMHLADGYSGPIKADTLARALDWCEYLEGHARRIYSPATDTGLIGAHLILKRRADLGERFTARDVYRRCWSGLADVDTAEAALDVLVEYGHLHTVDLGLSPGGGRPSVHYAWSVT